MTTQSGTPTRRVDIVGGRFTPPAPRNDAAKAQMSAETPAPPAPSRQSKLPDYVLAGKPIGKGPRRLLWLIYAYARLYKFAWIPQPRPCGLYPRRSNEIRQRVSSLRQLTMAIIAVITVKGGATKTTVATWLAVILMWIIEFQVDVFDADKGGGKVVKRYGLDPHKTLSGTEAAARITTKKYEPWNPTYEDIVAHTTAETGGVRVYHSPAGDVLSFQRVKEMTPKLKQNCHTFVFDTGPGFKNSTTDGIVAVSTVHIVVADGNSGEDLDDIEETLNHPDYGLRAQDKIGQVVIAISGIHWLQFNTRTQYEYAKRYSVAPDQIVLIPYNRYLAQNKRSQTVRIDAMDQKTLYAWCTLVETVEQKALAYNESHPFRPLPGGPVATTPDDTPVASSGHPAAADTPSAATTP